MMKYCVIPSWEARLEFAHLAKTFVDLVNKCFSHEIVDKVQVDELVSFVTHSNIHNQLSPARIIKTSRPATRKLFIICGIRKTVYCHFSYAGQKLS